MIVFSCLGFGFLIVGILMLIAIKNNFAMFYNKVKCVLWLATLMLAIPLFLRAINWIT